MKQSFKATVKEKLILAAKSYSNLLKKRIVVSSPQFEISPSYIVRFYETNFLHLTGVQTHLRPLDFYDKCLNETISEEEFDCESTTKIKGLVRLKMRHLDRIDELFKQDLLVQENFEKGKIKCMIAASDGSCTIGFVDAKYCVRPKTILDKNHLNKNKPICVVTPIIETIE